jgi:hypothetical protein
MKGKQKHKQISALGIPMKYKIISRHLCDDKKIKSDCYDKPNENKVPKQ